MHDRDERTLYARQRDRIAELEAELAERTKERDELRYEKRARSSIDPNERLHNLCDGLAASRAESPYDQESWDLADASNRELQTELAAERGRQEAAKKDAARYRWLKINARRIDFAGLCVSDGAQLDARIDAAMKD